METKRRKRESKLEFKQSKADGLWYWRVVSGNGWIVGRGAEGAATKSNAKRSFIRMLEGLDLDELLGKPNEAAG